MKGITSSFNLGQAFSEMLQRSMNSLLPTTIATGYTGTGLSTGDSPLLKEEDKKNKLISKKKVGTRGLQIPNGIQSIPLSSGYGVNITQGLGIQI